MLRSHRHLAVAVTAVAAVAAATALAACTAPVRSQRVPAPAAAAETALAPGEAAPPLSVASHAHATTDQWRTPVSTAALLPAAEPAMVPAAATASTPPGKPGSTTLSRHVKPACVGTGTDGPRVQVLYARDSNKTSRFAKVLPVLRTQVASVDDLFAVSSAKSGGGKRVRWVMNSACQVVIKEVVLPKGTLASGNWNTFRAAMAKKGYTSNSRKYLTFGDANAICGLGDTYIDDTADPALNWNNGKAPMYARVDSGCWLPGTSTSGNAPAHELMHTLGAVSREAPHATSGGHCTDTTDTMCYKDSRKTVLRKVCAGEALFDCRGDDYFNLKPAAGSWLSKHWNTADSAFLTSVAKLPSVPTGSTVSGPSTARTGSRFALKVKAPAGAVSYRWSGPGIVAGATSTKATARVSAKGTVKYRVQIAFRNGRVATVHKTVVVKRS